MENQTFYKKIDKIEFKTLLNRYRAQKNIYNNFFDFGFDLAKIEVFCGNKTFMIRKPENNFYRCYIISADYQEAVEMLKNHDFENAINVPSKNSIDEWMKLFLDCGYSCIGIYERMYYQNIKKRTKREPLFADKSHLDEIYDSLYSSFYTIVDHLPTKENLAYKIDNKQVLISQNNSEKKGFLIYTIEGKKCYFNAWLDNTGEGLLLLLDVFNVMILHEINYAYFWVNSTNIEVKKIHQLFGAKFDGLRDYTFAKLK